MPAPKPVRKLLGGLESRSTRPNKPHKATALGQLKPRKLLALDTETTGLDLWHGCRPFFVSIMDEDGKLTYWEWDVNPLTRNVGYYEKTKKPEGVYEESVYPGTVFRSQLPIKDKNALTELLNENNFVLHNTKFDARGLELSGLPRIPFATSHDTLIASHCLVSNESHKLKDLALQYLDIGDDDQTALRDAVNDARRIARQLGWAIANGPHPHFPAAKSSKDGWWSYDYWLPRAVAKYKWETELDPTSEWYPPGFRQAGEHAPDEEPLGHPWWTVLKTYALRDVERTFPLWWMQKKQLEEEGLWPIYEERLKLLEASYQMETNGVTISKPRLLKLVKKLAKESGDMERKCLKLAKGKLDNLNSPKQLTGILYGNLGIKPVKLTNKGIANARSGQSAEGRDFSDYSTNAEAMNTILERLHESNPKPYLPPGKRQAAYDFVWNLLGFRAREKSLDYLNEYANRATAERGGGGTLVLHPSFNPTGSDTLRFSSSGPNAQNIGKGNKRKDDPVPSLRSVFGPGEDREWYSIDYSNIELRIFSYQSGDQDLIDAYEQGYKVHCIFAKLLWEKEYKQCEKDAVALAKKRHKAKGGNLAFLIRKAAEELFEERYYETLYQWTKNGNFGLIYGAGEAKADSTYHRPGAYRLIRSRMPMIDEFMSLKNHEARTYGYIKTLGGYRLYVPANEPHVAVNYFVQGSAGWCMVLAINRVHAYLRVHNASLRQSRSLSGVSDDYQMIMTIHDELDFDFPKHKRNQEVITRIARLMEQSGTDIGVPTPVSVEIHTDNWSEGEKVSIAA